MDEQLLETLNIYIQAAHMGEGVNDILEWDWLECVRLGHPEETLETRQELWEKVKTHLQDAGLTVVDLDAEGDNWKIKVS